MALARMIFISSLVFFSLLIIASASANYGPAPNPELDHSKSNNPIPTEDQKTYREDKDQKNTNSPAIEGLVLCKRGPNYIPVIGAVVRITCQVVGDDDDCETYYSEATDSNGYFFKALSSPNLTDGLKLKECKVFLDNSPMEDCKIPTDVNRGIRGALLNTFRILDHNNIKLFNVGPFFYTSEASSQYLDGLPH